MGMRSIWSKIGSSHKVLGELNLPLVALVLTATYSSNNAEAKTAYESNVVPFMSEYCFDCHGEDRQKADLNLEAFTGDVLLYKQPKLWQRVIEVIETREMPPEKKPQPSSEQRFKLARFLRAQLKALDCNEVSNPGRVTIRRLNKIEYNNTIQDLFKIEITPADDFPNDEVGYGFDNIADVLSIPPILMEKYLTASEKIAQTALLPQTPEWPPRERHQAEDFVTRSDHIRPSRDKYLGLYREGSAYMELESERDAKYTLKFKAYGEQAGPEPPKLSVSVAGNEGVIFDVPQEAEQQGVFSMDVALKKGNTRITVSYLNNFNDSNFEIPELSGDRNLFIDYVDIIGPLDIPAPDLPASHTRIISKSPVPGEESEVARSIVKKLATKAFRRPATTNEIQRLTSLVIMVLDDGGTFEQGIQLAVQAIISSPKFLFRWELDTGLMTDEELAIRNINNYEIASRLSYFLWNSMPDDELFDLAEAGRLIEANVLDAQINRMLKDKKAKRFIHNFAGQWLQIRNLDSHSPDPNLFPEFNEKLRLAMKRETELLFEEILAKDLPLTTLLDADFTFLNKPLAKHYGMPAPDSEEFVKVSLPANNPRGGVLTHASILTITSNPTRTSPVIRGKWILEQILGSPPPPPPPNVPEIEESKEAMENASFRERLELHRDKPDCSGCHAKMDPIGFAFENFDAVGKWRTHDGTFKIDPSGKLPDGRGFDGPSSLRNYLLTGDAFVKSLSEKMLTYALGRGLDYYDQCAIEKIVNRVKNTDYKFSSMIKGIIFSDPFLKRNIKDQDDE